MVLKRIIKSISYVKGKYNKLCINFKILVYKRYGIKIGKNFKISYTVYIDLHCPHLIEIGDNVQLTRGSMILCYDSAKDLPYFSEYFKKSPYGKVTIGNQVYIGAHSIIMPGVTIGNNVIVGANSLILNDVPSDCIVGGNPAKKIRDLKPVKE